MIPLEFVNDDGCDEVPFVWICGDAAVAVNGSNNVFVAVIDDDEDEEAEVVIG